MPWVTAIYRWHKDVQTHTAEPEAKGIFAKTHRKSEAQNLETVILLYHGNLKFRCTPGKVKPPHRWKEHLKISKTTPSLTVLSYERGYSFVNSEHL